MVHGLFLIFEKISKNLLIYSYFSFQSMIPPTLRISNIDIVAFFYSVSTPISATVAQCSSSFTDENGSSLI